jgi:hypothetical protein
MVPCHVLHRWQGFSFPFRVRAVSRSQIWQFMLLVLFFSVALMIAVRRDAEPLHRRLHEPVPSSARGDSAPLRPVFGITRRVVTVKAGISVCRPLELASEREEEAEGTAGSYAAYAQTHNGAVSEVDDVDDGPVLDAGVR